MHAMLLKVQGSVWWVTETQETVSRSPEIRFEAATLANGCNIQHDTQARLNDVESLFLAAWRFTVLLAHSARHSWSSHTLIQLGMDVVDSERRSVGWQGQRRSEIYSLSQEWGAERGAVRLAHYCGAMAHSKLTTSPSLPWHAQHPQQGWQCRSPFFAWCSTEVRHTGFLCLALVWLVVLCHHHGSKEISSFEKLLKICPSGFLENLEIWMVFRGRILMILCVGLSFVAEVSSSVYLRLKSSLKLKCNWCPPTIFIFQHRNIFY